MGHTTPWQPAGVYDGLIEDAIRSCRGIYCCRSAVPGANSKSNPRLLSFPPQHLYSGKQIIHHGSQQAAALVLTGECRIAPYT